MTKLDSTSQRLEKRAKVLFSVLFLLFIFNLYLLLFVESQNFIDSIYFIVVTVSTVGFGDITPEYQITKISITLLIIAFLGSIATLSEFIVNRLVTERKDTDILFKEIINQDHIIIFGDGEIAQRLAELWHQRFQQVYLIGDDKATLRRLTLSGITTYLPPDRPYFDELSLSRCQGVYILDKEDDEIIKYSSQMKKYALNLRIYILTKKHIQNQHTKYLPINESFKVEKIVGEEISRSGRSIEFIPLVVKPEIDSLYRPVLVRAGSKPSEFFDNFVNTGVTIPISYDTEDALLVFVPSTNEVARRYSREVTDVQPLDEVFDKIWIGGYTEFTKKVIRHMGLVSTNFTMITFDPEQHEMATKHGLRGVLIGSDEFESFFEKNIDKEDIFIDFFDNLTDSLYISSVMQESDKRPTLYQIVYDDVQLDIFANASIEHMISPNLLTTRKMFNALAQDLGYAPSVISTRHHVFEHKVTRRISGKSVEDLKRLGYNIIAIFKEDGTLRVHDKSTRLHEDNILIVQARFEV